jgi:hypothetical protein
MPPDTLPRSSSTGTALPTEFRLEEFRQLRATIRERTIARVAVSLITFVSWGVLALGLPHSDDSVVSGLVPLVVLVAGFELVFALHVGVERIGRYVAVFYETAGEMPKWETAIAAFGRSPARQATQTHVLLATEFIVATALNLLFAVEAGLAALPKDLALAVFHAAFIARIAQAVRQASRQRDVDAAAFSAIARDIGS